MITFNLLAFIANVRYLIRVVPRNYLGRNARSRVDAVQFIGTPGLLFGDKIRTYV